MRYTLPSPREIWQKLLSITKKKKKSNENDKRKEYVKKEGPYPRPTSSTHPSRFPSAIPAKPLVGIRSSSNEVQNRRLEDATNAIIHPDEEKAEEERERDQSCHAQNYTSVNLTNPSECPSGASVKDDTYQNVDEEPAVSSETPALSIPTPNLSRATRKFLIPRKPISGQVKISQSVEGETISNVGRKEEEETTPPLIPLKNPARLTRGKSLMTV